MPSPTTMTPSSAPPCSRAPREAGRARWVSQGLDPTYGVHRDSRGASQDVGWVEFFTRPNSFRQYQISAGACGGRETQRPAPDLRPALELAHRELADHLHASRAVVEAGDGGEILAAVVLE